MKMTLGRKRYYSEKNLWSESGYLILVYRAEVLVKGLPNKLVKKEKSIQLTFINNTNEYSNL